MRKHSELDYSFKNQLITINLYIIFKTYATIIDRDKTITIIMSPTTKLFPLLQ